MSAVPGSSPSSAPRDGGGCPWAQRGIPRGPLPAPRLQRASRPGLFGVRAGQHPPSAAHPTGHRRAGSTSCLQNSWHHRSQGPGKGDAWICGETPALSSQASQEPAARQAGRHAVTVTAYQCSALPVALLRLCKEKQRGSLPWGATKAGPTGEGCSGCSR